MLYVHASTDGKDPQRPSAGKDLQRPFSGKQSSSGKDMGNCEWQMSAFGYGCAKALLHTLNILCILTSLFIFGFAIVDIRILEQYGEEDSAGSLRGDLFVIAVCIVLVTVAVFGCIATVRENIKLLYLYLGFIMMIVVLELMVSIYVALERYGLEYKVLDVLHEEFFRNATEDKVQHGQYWNYLQMQFECCGLEGPGDYEFAHAPISLSCCPRAYRAKSDAAQANLYRICINSKSYHTMGCADAILFALRDSADCMLGIASMLFWFEISSMVLTMIVVHNLKNKVYEFKATIKY